jgi:2-dehydropantoate 2-reductase
LYPLVGNTKHFAVYEKLVGLLASAGFIALLDEDIETIIWDKLYTNAVFNCPCALLQLSPEDFMGNAMGVEIFKEIGGEVCRIATAKGIPMDEEKYWLKEGLTRVPTEPPAIRHYTSAVHDVSRKNKTEVDFLNGAIYREGQKLGIPTPYNELIWRLTKLLEETYDLRYVPET